MEMMILFCVLAVSVANILLQLLRGGRRQEAALSRQLLRMQRDLQEQNERAVKSFADAFLAAQAQTASQQNLRLGELTRSLSRESAALKAEVAQQLSAMQQTLSDSLSQQRTQTQQTVSVFTKAQETQFAMQDKRLLESSKALGQAQASFENAVSDRLQALDTQFRTFMQQSRESLKTMTETLQTSLAALRQDTNAQLETMRATVDEKLQKTLNDRISASFRLVTDRLQQVYEGLGEMKTLANGVGDLKKILSNVKTRGILGEYQLGAILAEVLSKDQYDENVATKRNSQNRVEYAIKLPGEDGRFVYLPVDAKFPADLYQHLLDANESGDPKAIEEARAALRQRIKGCAKDIHEKYIDPPATTEFGILFLPFEGLYAEVVESGLVDTLQRQYRVNIAGPSTFTALLNSLQLGFKTLAIQKRSSEVWNVLAAVKTEFEKFGDVLAKAQQRITQTGDELDKLIGVRTRQINQKLRDVASLPAPEAEEVLLSQ